MLCLESSYPFTYIKVASKLIGFVLLCLSPWTLFAQDLMDIHRHEHETVEMRWNQSSEMRPDVSATPFPLDPMGFRARNHEEQSTRHAARRPKQFSADDFTAYASSSGNIIAVLKVTITDNDMDLTSSEAHTELPEEFTVQGNYPNPFRTQTRIVYHLPEPAKVHAEVFDLLGRLIYTSQVQKVAAGWDHTLMLDLPKVSSGLYIYRVNAESVSGTLTRTDRIIQVQ